MRKTIIITAFLLSVMVSGLAVFADNAVAGGADDPLVTLSYIKQVLQPQIEAEILAKVAGGNINIDDLVPPAQAQGYVVVEIKKGQILLPKVTIEAIVRPGSKAEIVSPSQTLGLLDITDGAELLNGKEAPINHCLLIPRPDGRGLRVLTDVAYIMVRGEYEIVG